jgi:hypothetical protein
MPLAAPLQPNLRLRRSIRSTLTHLTSWQEGQGSVYWRMGNAKVQPYNLQYYALVVQFYSPAQSHLATCPAQEGHGPNPQTTEWQGQPWM